MFVRLFFSVYNYNFFYGDEDEAVEESVADMAVKKQSKQLCQKTYSTTIVIIMTTTKRNNFSLSIIHNNTGNATTENNTTIVQ